MTYREYLKQPASVMVQWYDMRAAELEGQVLAERIAEAKVKARTH